MDTSLLLKGPPCLNEVIVQHQLHTALKGQPWRHYSTTLAPYSINRVGRHYGTTLAPYSINRVGRHYGTTLAPYSINRVGRHYGTTLAPYSINRVGRHYGTTLAPYSINRVGRHYGTIVKNHSNDQNASTQHCQGHCTYHNFFTVKRDLLYLCLLPWHCKAECNDFCPTP